MGRVFVGRRERGGLGEGVGSGPVGTCVVSSQGAGQHFAMLCFAPQIYFTRRLFVGGTGLARSAD